MKTENYGYYILIGASTILTIQNLADGFYKMQLLVWKLKKKSFFPQIFHMLMQEDRESHLCPK